MPVYRIDYIDGDWEEMEELDLSSSREIQILESPPPPPPVVIKKAEPLLKKEEPQQEQAAFPPRKRRKKRDKKEEDAITITQTQSEREIEQEVAFKKEEAINAVKEEDQVQQQVFPVFSTAVQLAGHDYLVQTWRDRLPNPHDNNYPARFQQVLQLMDELADNDLEMRPVQNFCFEEEMYSHKRHGARPGIKTREKLRDRQKNGDCRLEWHKHRGEWSPPTKELLAHFIEVLLEIAGEFVF